MGTSDALKVCVDGNYQEIARRLGLSKALVYKWTEPSDDFSDSGAYNPLDRLEAIIEESSRVGTPASKAFAPIQYLCAHFGGYFMPPVPVSGQCRDVQIQICLAMKKLSDAFAVGAEALEDDELTPAERRAFVRTAYDGLHEFTKLIGLFEANEG